LTIQSENVSDGGAGCAAFLGGWVKLQLHLTVGVSDGLADYKNVSVVLKIRNRNHTANLCGMGGLVWL
jgi:hypothetical protein